MQLLIIPILLNLFISVIKALFRIACIVLTGIAGAIGTARNGSERRAELENRMQLERAKAERIEADRAARIERERIKADRDAIRFEWAVQREADWRAELEYKRARRERLEAERIAADRNGADLKRRLARDDMDYYDQALTDLTPLVDAYRETFEQTLTDKTREQAYKKLYQLEARQHRLDKARQKALNQLGGA